MDRTNACTCYYLRIPSAGTLTETTAYTALDEHDHINVGEQLESYMCMFQQGVPRETWQ